jgi:hypothetical protein
MRENCTSGTARGAPGNRRSYRGAAKGFAVNFDWSVIDPYLPAIQALPFRNPLTQRDIRTPDFRVFRDDQLEIYFAPFLCLKPEARIVIIGITPGWQQMELAIRTF